MFRYYEDLTVPEIARIMSLPEGTVKRRLHEAKNLVRAKIVRTVQTEDSSNGKEGQE